MYKNEMDFSNEIEELLRQKGLNYKKDVIVGSSRADYFLESNEGTLIFEIKDWEPTQQNLELSYDLSKINTSGSGVDMAYVIVPDLKKDYPEKGVLSFPGAKKLIEEFAIKVKELNNITTPSKEKLKTNPIPKEKIFAIMPFSQEFNDTFVAMKKATLSIKVECIRADQPPETGDIVMQILEKINSSIAVIVDLSEPKPNVYYELGYAIGKNKEVIQICSTPYNELPFDIRNNNTIQYTKGDTNKLFWDLRKMLKTLRKSQHF